MRLGPRNPGMGVARSGTGTRPGTRRRETAVHLGGCRRELSRLRQQPQEHRPRSGEGPGRRLHGHRGGRASHDRRCALPYLCGRAGGVARGLAARRLLEDRTHGDLGLPTSLHRRRREAGAAHPRRHQHLHGRQPDLARRRRRRVPRRGQTGLDHRPQSGERHHQHHVHGPGGQVLQPRAARSAGIHLLDAPGPGRLRRTDGHLPRPRPFRRFHERLLGLHAPGVREIHRRGGRRLPGRHPACGAPRPNRSV